MKLPQSFRLEKNLEHNVEELLNPKNPVPKPTDLEYISLNNISCIDAYGDQIEHYKNISIKTSIASTKNGKSFNLTMPGAVSYFERQKGDVFLPSCALTCNILARLYKLKFYKDMENVLLQYKNHGLNDGWHVQNTIVDWEAQRIIHYPGYSEIQKKIKKREINQKIDCTILGFTPEKFEDGPLESLLKNHYFEEFIKNLTCLEDPEILVSIGEYFNKPTRVWLPPNPAKEKKSSVVWIGCRHDNLDVYVYGGVNYSGPARGVFTKTC
ncbi:MAG: hypothetical protein Q8O03_08405 [Nanoarchaeota archaeon]|nr:hypothetical protein [Nanoarchaeota archaeon]